MKVVLFGATGMVGRAALRECLLDPEVREVLAVGRAATGQKHEKLRELVRKDLYSYAGAEAELTGYDACFFCLGVSSSGMSEADYQSSTRCWRRSFRSSRCSSAGTSSPPSRSAARCSTSSGRERPSAFL